MQEAELQDLLRRVAAGDRGAFEAFVRRFEGPLYGFLLRVTGSSALAEDARQLTFVRVFRRAATFHGGSVSVWLFRTAYRIAIDVHRRESRAVSPAVAAFVERADGSPSPHALAEQSERRSRVRAALAELSDDDRALVWLRVAEELSFADVAEVTGQPASTLRYRFLRALRRLRKHLGTPVDCGLDA